MSGLVSCFKRMFASNPTNWSASGILGPTPAKWNPTGSQELATLGAGCFWGTEKYFANDFEKKHPGAVLGTSVGFMNPDPNAKPNPSYYSVCQGNTGHVEVLHMMFDNKVVSYEEVLKFFFMFHDPSTLDKQGNDSGSQYASAIFYHSKQQKQTAQKVKDKV